MKLKGINPLEHHVEKIVLAAMAAVFLAVFAMQLLWQPNRIKIENQVLRPDQRFTPAEMEAIELQNKLRAEDVRLPTDLPDVRLAEDFRQRVSGASVPRTTIAQLGPGAGIAGSVSGAALAQGAAGTGPVGVPKFAAPVEVLAVAHSATVDPVELLENADLRTFLPAEQPFDKAAASVEATFSGSALRAALETDPDGDGPARPMPPGWWRGENGFDVIGLQVEREERTATGEWSGLAVVPAIPGRINLISELDQVRSSAGMATIVADARRYAEDIQRPLYLRTIAGPAWEPPAEMMKALAVTGPNPEQANFQSRLDRIDDQLAEQQDTLARANEILAAPEPEAAGPRSGGGNRDMGGGGGQGVNPEQDAIAQRRKAQQDKGRAESRIKTLQADRTRLLAQATERGITLEDVKAVAAAPQPQAATGFGQPARTSIFDSEKIRVWAHDISATPGKVYRYRVAIVFNNPAFGRGGSLPEDQQSLAQTKVLMSEPSAWSEPVMVDPQTYFFITSATAGDADGRGARAGAELYRFFYGYWRKATTSLSAGDVLVGEAKLPENLYTFDLAALRQQMASPDGFSPSGPGRMPGRDTVEGPGGKGGQTGQGGDIVISSPSAPGSTTGTAGAVPAGATVLPRELPVVTEIVLLDAARAAVLAEGPGGLGAGGATARFQAMLKDGTGAIVVRRPDLDTGSETYRRLDASARLGLTQGVEAPAEPKREPRRPQPQEREQRRPADSGGGGGGG